MKKNLEKGTVIARSTGYIMLTSEYDENHGWYECVDMDIDENGNLVENGNISRVTPSDLIDGEIC